MKYLRIIYVLILFMISPCLIAQQRLDTLYFDSNNNIVEPSVFADIMVVLQFSSDNSNNRFRSFDYPSMKKRQDGYFSSIDYSTGIITKEGINYVYDKNGNVSNELSYVNGILNGVSTEYHENGKLKFSGRYKDGNPIGAHKIYNEQGKLEFEQMYISGVATFAKIYYPNGRVHMECGIVNGMRDGIYREYYENGSICVLGSYSNDLPDGVFTFYDEDGREVEKRRANNGEWQ